MTTLPPELVHPEWNGSYADPQHSSNFNNVPEMDIAKSWAVVLKFRLRTDVPGAIGQIAHGSGFFLNLPDVETHELILTAAHNLVSESSGKSVEDLEVFLFEGDNLIPLEIDSNTPDKGVWVCPAYHANRKLSKYDYGAIRVKRRRDVPARGFGFSMPLGEAKSPHGATALYITGYQDKVTVNKDGKQIREPNTSTGKLLQYPGDHYELVEYDVWTEQGISGSAVWMGYDGKFVAVAIHNRGKPTGRKTGGSRGARLTQQLLREIFSWFGVGRYGVKLQVQKPRAKRARKPPDEGLFLKFSDDYDFARVKLGDGSRFNVIPAHITGQKDKVSKFYALMLCEKCQWVLFDPAQQQVILRKDISDRCLFREKEQLGVVGEHPVNIIMMYQHAGKEFQLRLQNDDFIPGDDESSEVTLIETDAEKTTPFMLFGFVKA